MRKYELSITPSYVADWGVTEAVRELFQNALHKKILRPLTIYDRFTKWYRRYRHLMDPDCRERFRELLSELKDFRRNGDV